MTAAPDVSYRVNAVRDMLLALLSPLGDGASVFVTSDLPFHGVQIFVTPSNVESARMVFHASDLGSDIAITIGRHCSMGYDSQSPTWEQEVREVIDSVASGRIIETHFRLFGRLVMCRTQLCTDRETIPLTSMFPSEMVSDRRREFLARIVYRPYASSS